MNKTLTLIVAALGMYGCASAQPTPPAADRPPGGPDGAPNVRPDRPREQRGGDARRRPTEDGRREWRGEEVTVTFLGVEASPLDPQTRSQIKIAGESGLQVNFVSDDSPAKAAGLQQHDVLAKVDDQVLYNPPQLMSLIHARKPGDEVKLTIIRGGESKTITAKLGERKMRVPQFGPMGMGMGMAMPGPMGMGGAAGPMAGAPGPMGMGGAAGPMGGAPGPMGIGGAAGPMGGPPGGMGWGGPPMGMEPGMRPEGAAVRSLTMSDDAMKIEVKSVEGSVTLTATGKDGVSIFSGPIETAEQRAKLPDGVRTRLNELAMDQMVKALRQPSPARFPGMFGPPRDGRGPQDRPDRDGRDRDGRGDRDRGGPNQRPGGPGDRPGMEPGMPGMQPGRPGAPGPEGGPRPDAGGPSI